MKKCLGCFREIDDHSEVCPHCEYVEGTPTEEAIHFIPGTILVDRYIIGKVVGYGGFGVTYVAWDKKLELRVAIKEYLPSEFSTRMPGQSQVNVFSGDKREQFIQGLNRFMYEAKRLAKFSQENGIVRIMDCIDANGTAYIIMEYLEGETLTEYLKKVKIVPEDKAIEMLMPVMKSLENVHKAGIIHRDIAPDNIIVTKDGTAKLIDFAASRFATTTHSRSLTVIVKPGYSPEEQYRSRGDQGAHTDVYSLAATIYKMITGVTPPDALERRTRIENAKKDVIIDPHKIVKGISLSCENALMNALNIRIEDRTPTISKFIEEIKSDTPVPRRHGKIKKIDFYTWPKWIKIAIPVMVCLVAIAGVLLFTGVIKFESMFSSGVELPDGYTIVPDVKTLSNTEAQQKIAEAGLEYYVVEAKVEPSLEAGTVLYQEPGGGNPAPINSRIRITLSQGNGDVTFNHIPFYLGRTVEEVQSDLSAAGIKYDEDLVYEYSNIAEGNVLKLLYEDDTEAEFEQECNGQTVRIVVSKGPEPVSQKDINTIAADMIAFMYEPNEAYSCDINKDGSNDYLVFKDHSTALACYATEDKICVIQLDFGSNVGEQIYFSSGLNGIVIKASKNVGSSGFVRYYVFDGSKITIDAEESFSREDNNMVYDYHVNGSSASTDAYNSKVASYGDLTPISPTEISVRQINASSSQIIAISDGISAVAGNRSNINILDINNDGVNDCVYSCVAGTGSSLEHWEGIEMHIDTSYSDLKLGDCTVILLSDNENFEIRYYHADEGSQFINEMLNN